MKSFAPAVIATISLLQLASALPQNSCPPGTQFHTCSNGYTGCYEESPCDYPAKQDTIDPNECPENYKHYDCSNGSWHRHVGCYTNSPCPQEESDPTAPAPAPAATPSTAPPSGSCAGNDTLWVPEMHNYVTPESDNGEMFPSRSLYNTINVLRGQGGRKEWRQVAIFRSVPADARTCRLNIRYNSGGHIFTTLNSGDLRAHRLRELPAEDQPMIYENIEPLVEEDADYRHELSNWDQREGPNFFQPTGGMEVECSEVMAFRLSIAIDNDPENWGALTMEQGVNLGLALSYTC